MRRRDLRWLCRGRQGPAASSVALPPRHISADLAESPAIGPPEPGGYAVITHAGCSCGLGPTRRGILQGGLATSVLAARARSAMAQGAAAPTAAGVRAIDTHAHYFPQSYLDLVAGEGPRFKYEVVTTEDTFMIKSPVFSPGPLPKKFIAIKQRLADIEAQRAGVHALSLTAPMLYCADADLSHRLPSAWNDAPAPPPQTPPAPPPHPPP